jgi:tRNA (guanine-N7-)-methyltransferase
LNDTSVNTPPTAAVEHLRSIRSYVIRGGRLTPSQEHALTHYWPRFGIDDVKAPFNQQTAFGRTAPLVLEIGFGMGDSLAAMAQAHPEQDFLGIEVHRPGVGKLLDTIEKEGISNIRIYCHDAKEILGDCIAPESLDVVQIFFPDPWHKKRHHKRRLIQSEFVALLHSRLKPGGLLHMATDWQPYAEHMMQTLSAAPGWENQAGPGLYGDSSRRESTKFEKRGQRLGHGVWDLLFIRQAGAPLR